MKDIDPRRHLRNPSAKLSFPGSPVRMAWGVLSLYEITQCCVRICDIAEKSPHCDRQIVTGLARHEIGVSGDRFVDDEIDLAQRT